MYVTIYVLIEMILRDYLIQSESKNMDILFVITKKINTMNWKIKYFFEYIFLILNLEENNTRLPSEIHLCQIISFDLIESH
jgi:hypothetical protein